MKNNLSYQNSQKNLRVKNMSKIIYLNDKQINKLLTLLIRENNKDLETLQLLDKLNKGG